MYVVDQIGKRFVVLRIVGTEVRTPDTAGGEYYARNTPSGRETVARYAVAHGRSYKRKADVVRALRALTGERDQWP
jgi:hypothetical protein